MRKNEQSNRLQSVIDEAVVWTKSNDMIINVAKTQEMTMSSSKLANEFQAITIEDKELERVNSAKLVDVIIQNDLKWDAHVHKIVSKAKQKLCFMLQLRKVGLHRNNLLCFYNSVVCSNLEYAVPVFAHQSTKIPPRRYRMYSKRSHENHLPQPLLHRSPGMVTS